MSKAATASINESTYGGVADSYANRYGIPTNVFRDAIRNVSNFDPSFSSKDGNGIARLNVVGDSKWLPNPSDVGSSLDFAARLIASDYKSSGSWDKAVSSFMGLPEPVGTGGEIFGDPINKSANPKYVEKPGMFSDITTFLRDSAWTITFVIVGATLIIGSIWILVKTSGDTK
jgi:hypothetical protein